MESYIYIKEARFHACHGVLPQEQTVGQDFLVSIRCGVDITMAMEHDMLEVALDYGVLYRLIEHEMGITSQLVEHVAGRIARQVFITFPQVTSIDLTITKLNPPIGGDCEGAGVEVHLTNDKTR
ncbi:MAG: dihydroneopterin aldolase [Prevotella sp.]|nr:dihydroneopterin aldolase [Prevotella sp.]